jgi:hypothetical protein
MEKDKLLLLRIRSLTSLQHQTNLPHLPQTNLPRLPQTNLPRLPLVLEAQATKICHKLSLRH